MHDQRLRTEKTPKRVFPTQYSLQTPVSGKPMPPQFYNTPERIAKSPFRTHSTTIHRFNETQEQFRQTYQPQQLNQQSSTMSISQEINSAHHNQQRDVSPLQYQPNQQYQRIMNLENEVVFLKQQIEKGDRELLQYKRFYNQYQSNDQGQSYKLQEQIKQLEEKLMKQSDTERIIGLLKDQINKKDQQYEDSKLRILEQENKISEYERRIKNQKAQLKEKDKEIYHLIQDVSEYEQRALKEESMKVFTEEQLNKFKDVYEELTKLNDELAEENVNLKMILLKQDNNEFLQQQSCNSSKRQSEQLFQQHIIEETDLSEMLESFLMNNSDEILNITNDKMIKQIFLNFRTIFNKLLSLNSSRIQKQEQEDTRQMTLPNSMIQSAEFNQDQMEEEIQRIQELREKSQKLEEEIKERKKLLIKIDDKNEKEEALVQIQELEKECDSIEILLTSQSECFQKGMHQQHKNSVVSFDQNFENQHDHEHE